MKNDACTSARPYQIMQELGVLPKLCKSGKFVAITLSGMLTHV